MHYSLADYHTTVPGEDGLEVQIDYYITRTSLPGYRWNGPILDRDWVQTLIHNEVHLHRTISLMLLYPSDFTGPQIVAALSIAGDTIQSAILLRGLANDLMEQHFCHHPEQWSMDRPVYGSDAYQFTGTEYQDIQDERMAG